MMKNEEILCYKAGALLPLEVEGVRCLNLDLDDVYEGFYTIQLPVDVGGVSKLMEVRFQLVGSDGVMPVFSAAELVDVVHACAVLGDRVRIPVEVGGERLKNKRGSAVDDTEFQKPVCYGSNQGRNPQTVAENGCEDCGWAVECFKVGKEVV